MDKRILKALKVLVFNPILLDAKDKLESEEYVLETLSGSLLTEETVQDVEATLGAAGRSKSAINMINDAMDACDEEASS